VSDGTIKVKQEPGKVGPDNTVKIEAREKDATAKTDQPVVAGPPATVKTEATRALPVRRIKVDTVKMVANVCP
jgi:hypothetical protein